MLCGKVISLYQFKQQFKTIHIRFLKLIPFGNTFHSSVHYNSIYALLPFYNLF